jgi:hypothetical protein
MLLALSRSSCAHTPAEPARLPPAAPPAGDGWSPRMEDAILHGCIPVIIQDNVHLPYENVLDYESFTLRIPEDKLTRVPAVLRNVPSSVVAMMQANLAKVWYRFR